MRISELSQRTAVPVATLKYYVREGLLPRGTPTAATQAVYDEHHVERVRLITALTAVRGLPIARVREILSVIDESAAATDGPVADPVAAMGRAINALPPYVDLTEPTDGTPRARAAVEALGLTFEPQFAAVRQLEVALQAVESVGLPIDSDTLHRYGEAALAIARGDIGPIGEGTVRDPITYAVLGTALYEPVLLALRRMAHLHLLRRATEDGDDAPPAGSEDRK